MKNVGIRFAALFIRPVCRWTLPLQLHEPVKAPITAYIKQPWLAMNCFIKIQYYLIGNGVIKPKENLK